ncbi:MAG: acyl-CoA dehydrogenase family protein [Gemmatimonadaceae bacterium]|nr:acyl-CoA dehydrogenase family protein [Gemmatimonadaceae bacterium]
MSTAAAHLAWPFFDAPHRSLDAALALAAERWTETPLATDVSIDDCCRAWVRRLGDDGFLRYCVPAEWGGALPTLDSRALCVLRERLAMYDGLADFAFAMQGLGSGAITLGGQDRVRAHWLPLVASGHAIAAFALSEPEAGSDAGAMRMSATKTATGWRLDGTKTWISNGGIADFYCVFARSDAESTGGRGISGFCVPADTPGLAITERIDVMSPHPLATLTFTACEVPHDALLGAEGDGFALAMRTLDIFRVSVAAAATGFARRALQAALHYADARAMFGATLSTQPLAQAMLGDMATDVDSAALLTYRAAWHRDTQPTRSTGVAAMAKLSATELSQQVIDRALQLHGGRGVRVGEIVERLYRDIRALRIYEGASEVQRLLIGRETLKAARQTP